MKSINDVIHGDIKIPAYLMAVIDTPIFQRLGRVKQLTSAEYVFPGARHTRKEHCIGAMYLSRKYAKALNLNEKDSKALAISALLHDVAHGSYSHSWDTIVYSSIYPCNHKGHDRHRHEILHRVLKPIIESGNLTSKSTDVFDRLVKEEVESDNILADDISKIWSNEDNVLSAILQGPLGVDRMDFVARDTFYTSTRHFGYIDMNRIINHVSVYTKENNEDVLVYHEDCIPDAIQGLRSRLYMYNQVYLHKTVIAAAILIEAALLEAVVPLNLVERTTNLNDFTYLTDNVMNEIYISCSQELRIARKYAKNLYDRNLPKMISEETIHISPETKHSHCPGIQINEAKTEITWVGRILSSDYAREFAKYDIHIRTETDPNPIPFVEYWKRTHPYYSVDTYYIKRVYRLNVLDGSE